MDAMSRLVKFDKQSIDRAAMALAKMFHCEERLVDEEDIFSYKRSNGIWVVGDVIAYGDRLSEQDEFWCSFNFTDMVRKVIRVLEEDDEQETAKAGDEDASNAEAEPCKEQVEAAMVERSRHQIVFAVDGIRKCCSCGAAVGGAWGDDRVAFERHVTTMMLEAARKAVM